MQIENIRKSRTRKLRTPQGEFFKTIVFALYKDFGFGRDRCAKALKSMTEIIEHSDTDEVFWGAYRPCGYRQAET